MKKRILLSTSILLLTVFVTGCSTATVVNAPNGKTYYVDSSKCSTYKLKGDAMFCYAAECKCDATVYQPVTSGCQDTDKQSTTTCQTKKVCKNTQNIK